MVDKDVIVLRTFSKFYGMAGVCAGFMKVQMEKFKLAAMPTHSRCGRTRKAARYLKDSQANFFQIDVIGLRSAKNAAVFTAAPPPCFIPASVSPELYIELAADSEALGATVLAALDGNLAFPDDCAIFAYRA